MEHYLRNLKFSRTTLVPDAMAGLTVALVSIPEGMAYALVAGVYPVYGLYTGMVTTNVDSLTVSTSLMVVTFTNALALVTADQLGALGSDVDPIRAMFTLTLLTGAVMFVLGVLRLGSVIRFVSREVSDECRLAQSRGNMRKGTETFLRAPMTISAGIR